MTLCTVAIPVYNRSELVRRAIESALAQRLDGLEVLVVDNCSTDGTWDAVRTYDAPNYRAVRNDRNLGLVGNLNRCLELAAGRFLLILCSDDALTPGIVARLMAALEARPGAALATTHGRFVDPAGRPGRAFADVLPTGVYAAGDGVRAAFRAYARYAENPFNYPSGVLFSRDAALRAGGFDPCMEVATDFDLFVRLADAAELVVLPDEGCLVTLHSGQVSGAMKASGVAMRELLAVARRFGPRLGPDAARVRRAFVGHCLGQAAAYRATGNRVGYGAFRDIVVESGVLLPGAMVALAETLARRWIRMR